MLDRFLARDTSPAWFFLLLFVVYTATAHYDGSVVNDVHSAAHAAWSLATRGTLDLSGLDLPYDQAWTADVDGALYSNRFPGVILAGVPMYLLLQPELPTVAPSAMAAALAAASGVTAMLVALRRLLPLRRAWGAAAVLGLGSAVWSVAADGLWSHGVTVLWLGLLVAGLAVAGRARAVVVVAAAMAVLTRPHLAVALAVTAAWLWRRDRAGALATAAGLLLGSAVFLVYGRLLFGEWSLMGPYEVYDYDRAVREDATGLSNPILWRGENLAMALVSTRVGLLAAYPALLLTVWALARRVRSAPTLPVALALGGVAYALVAVMMTRVSGGSGFWGNRTLIESVFLVWPLLTWALSEHRGGRVFRGLLAVTIAWSVLFHSLGALTRPAGGPDGESLFHWQVPSGLREAEPWQLGVVLLLALAAGALTWRVQAPGTVRDDPGPEPLREHRLDRADA